MWYSSCNTLQILQLELFSRSIQVQSTFTIHSDLTVSAFSSRHQQEIPLNLNRVTDLRQIESLIDEILHFEPNPELFESSPVLVNIKEAAAKLQSSVSALESTELDEQGHPSTPSLPLLQFIICQLENSLVPTKKRRYNVVTQVSVSRFIISMHSLYLYLTLGRCFESTVDITCLLSVYSIIGLSYSSNNKITSCFIIMHRVGQ